MFSSSLIPQVGLVLDFSKVVVAGYSLIICLAKLAADPALYPFAWERFAARGMQFFPLLTVFYLMYCITEIGAREFVFCT